MLKLLNKIKLPVILLILVSTFEYLSAHGVLPRVAELSLTLESIMTQYGLLVIGPMSFIENIVGVNVYFPGSIVILTAMALTAGNPARGFLTYLTIYGSAFVAYHVDYLIGRFATSKDLPTKPIGLKTGLNGTKMWFRFLTTFWHPHFAALTCVHVGSEGYAYSDILIYVLVSSFIWNTFWGVTMYYLGSVTGANVNLQGFVYIYLIGWGLLDTYRFYKDS